MKVIQADFSSDSKTIAVLEDSEDHVDWMNKWLELREFGFQPYRFKVTFFEKFNVTSALGDSLVYPVAIGESRVVS